MSAPGRCTREVERGVAAAERGEPEAALACFERAAVADAFDPWPKYHAGTALLELRRYDDAVATYRVTEAVAPGWYHCRSDRRLAEQLAAGAVDHETYRSLRQLVDGGASACGGSGAGDRRAEPPGARRAAVGAGVALEKQGRHAEAEEAFRRGLAIAEEPDVRTRLLVALANQLADPQAKERCLHEAVAVAGNLVAAATAMAMLVSRPPN